MMKFADTAMFKFDVELRKFDGGKVWKEMEVDGVKGVYVEGYASTETLDRQGEKVAKKAIEDALPDYIKTPSIKEMHNPFSLIGKAIKWLMDDKGLFVGSFIVDPAAINKVKMGMFTGYSIGGKRLEKVGNTITKLLLTEISLVDRGANPEATLLPIFKLYTGEENMDDILKAESFAVVAESLDAIAEGMDSGNITKGDIQPLINSAFGLIGAATAAGHISLPEDEDVTKVDYLLALSESLGLDGELVHKSDALAKAYADKIQIIHDEACGMGANCGGHDMDEDDMGVMDDEDFVVIKSMRKGEMGVEGNEYKLKSGKMSKSFGAGRAKRNLKAGEETRDIEPIEDEEDMTDEELEKYFGEGRINAWKERSVSNAAQDAASAGSTVIKPKTAMAVSKAEEVQESVNKVAEATIDLAKFVKDLDEKMNKRLQAIESNVASPVAKSAPRAFDKDGGMVELQKSPVEQEYEITKMMFDKEQNPMLKQELGEKCFRLRDVIAKGLN